ncbi:MAG: HDOD domain-containing protein [Deltaproteobacteria bacterium]|nr:HDOD domain-containing protein [Deltaproteobacteria bacterium]
MFTADTVRPLIADLIARNAISIPPYPANAMRLRALVSGGTFGINELSRIVKEDQVLAAAILRAANSAMFRRGDPITVIDKAVAQLGAEEVCRVALAASLGKIAGGGGSLVELRRIAWRQALAGAICAGHLGYRRGLNAETAFVCTLLHDFGRVIGIAALEEVVRTHKLGECLSAAEWSVLVEEIHIDVGLLMGTRWKLSDVILEVIACHHDPAKAEKYPEFVQVTAACDDIVVLMEKCPYLLPHDLENLATIRGAKEANALMEALPLIPAYLVRLSEMNAEQNNEASLVQKPSTLLEGPHKHLDIRTNWVRSNGDTICRMEFITADGLALNCAEPLPEGGVARIRLGDAKNPIEVSGRVLLTQKVNDRYRSEVQLFVLPGVGKSAWDELYRRSAA